MEFKRLREEPSLEVKLALAIGPLSRDIALEVLKKAEVRDALNFVIASGKDPRFNKIVELMNQEEIWKFWFDRDLSIVPKDKLYPIKWIDHPLKWKTYYLWYRLMIVRLQFAVLRYSTIINLKHTFKFVRLNVAQIDDEQPVNFSSILIEIMGLYNDRRLIYGYYNLSNLIIIANSFSIHKKDFLKMQYNFANDQSMDLYNNILERLEQGNFKYNFDYLSAPPRLIELTKLLVASCLTCGMTDDNNLQKEENNPNRIFCNENCQLSFYKN
jgi:hypothetical protein